MMGEQTKKALRAIGWMVFGFGFLNMAMHIDMAAPPNFAMRAIGMACALAIVWGTFRLVSATSKEQ